MIKLKFIKNNDFAISNNSKDAKEFNLFCKLFFDNFSNSFYLNKDEGWVLRKNSLNKVENLFSQYGIDYLNEPQSLPYLEMGKNMLLQPYDYQKEAIYDTVNKLNNLLILPCGSGN